MDTARPQQRYDHRLRQLVQRTGNLTIATDLGVPRSTARGWLRTAPTVVVSLWPSRSARASASMKSSPVSVPAALGRVYRQWIRS
jgi:hypothetical protein